MKKKNSENPAWEHTGISHLYQY